MNSPPAWIELNIDALVGPTHHFGGLGVGNVASLEHQHQVSNPKKAALAGLAKADLVSRLGVPQYLWLPPLRPRWDLLEQLGFCGSRDDQIKQALDLCPEALSAAFSSAYMWAANSATVAPSIDAADGRYHVTLANLISSWHRSSEARERLKDFQWITKRFPNQALHTTLPSVVPLRDEGAANHMRLCDSSAEIGFHIFVYGEATGSEALEPVARRFFPRQTLAACQAIARNHCLDPERTFFLRQHPRAIDAGVFHNDVIATSNQGLLIHHELAFENADAEIHRLEEAFFRHVGHPLRRIQVPSHELSLEDAVRSYFFNSQILAGDASVGDNASMAIVCPNQCLRLTPASHLIDRLISDSSVPIREAHYVSVDESMAGGGGPACLRLRMTVETEILDRIDRRLRATPENLDRLGSAIQSAYPESCKLEDFADTDFVEQTVQANLKLRSAVMDGPDA